MAKKIQIIGKVTGITREKCVAKFKASQDQLEVLGYEVVNPVTLVPEDATWQNAMRLCLLELMTVDAIAVQPDWFHSDGAKIEYMVANALQLQVIKL